MALFDFRCMCVVEREPLTAERVQTVVQRLWRHGLRYSDTPPSPPTWETQLAATGKCYLGNGFLHMPLLEASQRIANAGAGMLTLHDGELAVELYFGPLYLTEAAVASQALSPDRYSFLELRLGVSTMLPSSDDRVDSESTPDALPLLEPLQQVAMMYAHWCQTVADEAEALVALGFEPDGLDAAGASIGALFEAAASMLEAHNWSAWQPPDWLLMWYLSPSLLPACIPLQLLGRPGQMVERTPRGGMWGLMEQWEEFRQEARAMIREIRAGNTYQVRALAAQLHGETQIRDSATAQALQHFERALQLAQSRAYRGGESISAAAVAGLAEIQASLQLSEAYAADFECQREQRRAAMGKYWDMHGTPPPKPPESPDEDPA